MCGSAELAQYFSSFGLKVVGAPDFRTAISLLRDAQSSGNSFPIIVVDSEPSAGIKPWVESQSRRSDIRVIPGPGAVLDGHPLAVDLPITLGDLLMSFGLPAPLSDTSDLVVGFGGTVGASAPPAAVALTPQENLFADTPAPALPVHAAPAPQEDLFASMPAPAPQAVPPTLQPAQEPWLTQPTQAPDLGSQSRNVPAAPSPTPAPEIGTPQEPSEPDWLAEIIAEQNNAAQKQSQAAPAQPAAPAQHLPAQPLAQPVAMPAQSPPVQPLAHPVQPIYGADQQHAAPFGTNAVDNFFDSRNEAAQASLANRAQGECLIVAASKGGVGKTTFTLVMSQIAADTGLRVVAVDANRGQANLGQNLKIGNHPFPTIYDAKERGWEAAISRSEQMSAVRGARGAIGFDLVMGPPEHLADPNTTPASLYSDLVRELRKHYDLVIIDTQIIESHLTDLWSEFIIPELRTGAWMLGLFDKSPSALPDLHTDLQKLVTQYGLSRARLMVAANLWPNFDSEDVSFVTHHFSGVGQFVGAGDFDIEGVSDRSLAGELPTDNPSIAPMLREALHRVTGNPTLAAEQLTKKEQRLARRRERRKR